MDRYILFKHHETGAAILVSDSETSERFWLPLSQCEVKTVDLGELGKPDLVELDIPEWLARSKGLT